MNRFSSRTNRAKDTPRRAERSSAHGQPGRSLSEPPRPWLPRWAVAVLLTAVTAAVTFVVFEYVILSKVPRAMLGKWVVTQGAMEGATLEFFRDGTMTATVTKDGKSVAYTARVRADEKTVWSTTKHPMTGKEETAEQAIVTLTDNEFVLEDKKGAVLKMERRR
jgi:uncharacterized protein (TIGR03066 family)